MKRQIFLGGSCDPTTWRQDTAIPLLDRAGVLYYNPQVSEWHQGLIAQEAEAKEESEYLLFVIDGQTRAVASILEATEYICRGRKVLLVVEQIPDGLEIDGQPITGRQLKDLNRARSYLLDLAGRHDNVRVFPSIESSVRAAAGRLGRSELVTA